MILHIDMDAFFASIEQAINPRLKNKPLIVGSRANRLHTVVCAASYEAKRLGIKSGMPTQEAFRICPHLEFVPAEQGKYIWTSEQILELLKRWELRLNYASIDEFQMDIENHPDPLKLACDIQERIKGTFAITASIGIAPNCILAKLASKINKPCGITVLTPDNLMSYLQKIPLNKLCGLNGITGELFVTKGMRSCLDLYQKPSYFLKNLMGKNGLTLYQALHATESFANLPKESKPKSIGHSYTLPRASKTPQFIMAWIRLLAEMVARRLRENNLESKTTHLWLSGPLGSKNSQGQMTWQNATNDGQEIYLRCLRIKLKSKNQLPMIRALGVSCSNLNQPQYDSPLFLEAKRREGLLEAIDKINYKFGDDTIYPAIITLASHKHEP
ncbi:MAG: DNA polymerase IV [Candidatus Omnitrophica bacterium]|nr:DNA polymerase IV [Candidatus Omnitrophota bacterium]